MLNPKSILTKIIEKKFFIIRLSILLSIMFWLMYIFHPLFANNKNIEDFNIIYPIDTEFNNEINIYEINEKDRLFHLYTDILFKGTDWIIQQRILLKPQILLMSFRWNEWNSETLFHEYLHYVYLNSNITEKDKQEIMMEIGKDKNQLELLFMHTYMLYDNSDNLSIWLTEYISHTYQWYYNTCKPIKDNITDILIKKELLPDIYCKKDN